MYALLMSAKNGMPGSQNILPRAALIVLHSLDNFGQCVHMCVPWTYCYQLIVVFTWSSHLEHMVFDYIVMQSNVNVNLYSASSQKAPLMRSMCRVLIKKTRLQCTTKTVNLHVMSGSRKCFGTSSVSLVQRQRRCDGHTYRAETVEQRVDGGWRNEDAVVQQLERPVYTAQADNPVPGHTSTCTPSPQARMWLDLPHRANVAQNEGVSSRQG